MNSMIKKILHAGVPVPRLIRPVVRVLYRSGVVMVEGAALLRKIFWVEPILRSICAEMGSGLRAERLPYIRGSGHIRIGNNVHLSGRSCFYFISGTPVTPEIVVGDHAFIGSGCTFSAGASISIGAHCLISSGVRIHDNDGHPVDPERRRRSDRISANEVALVVIEDNVWIGANATILKGVHIGANSVIGTGAVVTDSVPRDQVVAGNPARMVKSL